MESRARQQPTAEGEREAKRPKLIGDSGVPGVGQRVVLNSADCNLDFTIEQNGLEGHALYDGGFAYCWSGARANIGITRGKYCFGCKIISKQSVEMDDTPPDQQHVCRVGISRGNDNVGNLGESEHSFGFGGTGKFSNSGKFSDYGTKFGVGDTIVCSVDLDSKPLAVISFSKNGQCLGIAKQFDAGPRGLQITDSPPKRMAWESALFPHVLLKNVVVQMQFSIEDGLVAEEGYKPWNFAVQDGNMIAGPVFRSPKDCEVIMMVGLPASGKTTWAEKWIKDHPEKRYVLLGTNLVLDQMKVPGLLRKQNYGERFDRLMDCATGIFNALLSRASKTPRNYILDQTNVYKSARKRKLKAFMACRKIAVVIFPSPQELKNRAERRFKEMGKEVPAEAVNEMLANYELPTSKGMPGADEFFDEVLFPELSREDSQKYLDEMKHELRAPLKPSDFSSYSQEGSVQSFSSCDPPNMSTARTSGHPMFYLPLPHLDPNFPCPQQARSYSVPELYERLGPPPGRGSDRYNSLRFISPTSSFSYDARGGSINDSRLPHESLPAPTRPPVHLQTSGSMASAPPPTHPHGDLPYANRFTGSPYAASPPKRPYGDLPPRDSISEAIYATLPPRHPYGDGPSVDRFSGSPYGVQPQRPGTRSSGNFAGSSPYGSPPTRHPYGDLPPPDSRYSGAYSSHASPGSRYY